MITADGWFDWMVRRPGPADKVYSQRNTAEWFIPHSAVGYYPGWEGRLFSTARNPDGSYTGYAAASVTGWVEQNGVTYQHYPIFASCWASGSRIPNTRGVAFEHAGGAPGNENEPFTPEQRAADIRILQDLAAFRGVDPVQYWRRPTSPTDTSATLYEHRECGRFGSLPTACPSGRVPWDSILAGLAGNAYPIPNPEEHEMQIYKHDAWAAFFQGLEVAGGADQPINAWQDFFGGPAPEGFRALEIEFLLERGYLEVYNGDGTQAGLVGWGTPAGQPSNDTVRVWPDRNGWFSLRAADTSNPIRFIGAHAIAYLT